MCGLVSQYNATKLPDGPDRLSLLMGTLLVKRIKVQGFIIFDDYGHRYDEFAKDMTQWLSSGQIKYREHLVDGLENVLILPLHIVKFKYALSLIVAEYPCKRA